MKSNPARRRISFVKPVAAGLAAAALTLVALPVPASATTSAPTPSPAANVTGDGGPTPPRRPTSTGGAAHRQLTGVAAASPTTATASATATATPATTAPSTTTGYREAMAAAAGPGGAEMGQSIKGSHAAKAGSTAVTEGSWSPSFGVKGLDVSYYQPGVNWQTQWNLGARFAYVKATEGNYYTNPLFAAQYNGARQVGMIRGAYHFANPLASSGADQARIFVKSGGGWSADGYTLPPVLDMEMNPYAGQTIDGFYQGNSCYDRSPSQLASWVRDFGNTMQSLTGRLPMIYTNTSWWTQCTANAAGFGDLPSVDRQLAEFRHQLRRTAAGQLELLLRLAVQRVRPLRRGLQCLERRLRGPATLRLNSGLHRSWCNCDGLGWAGGGNGKLGYPTSNERCVLAGRGCYQSFQGGTIHWSPATGAFATWGAIRTTWGALGYENGKLGYPTSNERCGLADGGCYQSFQGGTIHWSPATGAHATWGAIRAAWGALRYENGKLGYPTSNERCGLADGGCYQSFQGGTIHWSPATGAHATVGAIRAAWGALGYENSKLGYPTSNERCGLAGSGCYQSFQGGTIHWSPATGAHATWGAIRATWGALGYENSKLGYPTSNERCGLAGRGCYQGFQGGTIHWSPATGAHATWGAIRATWGALGYENGKLGYPTSNETCGLANAGCYQSFQGGTIHWSPRTGPTVSYT